MRGRPPAQKIKKNKNPNSKNYLDQEVQSAILEFQSEPDIEKRKKIFLVRIRPAFLKLIENIIFVYKFHVVGDIDILKYDCLSFLFETLNKFDGSRNSTAFSYFNIVCKNWFIQRVKVFKKKNSLDVPFDTNILSTLEKENNAAVVFDLEDEIVKKEFVEELKKEMVKWKLKFDKEQELKVLDAVITLFDNIDTISLYNKKAVNLYLKEISGLNTKQVVMNLVKFRKRYENFKKKFAVGEV